MNITRRLLLIGVALGLAGCASKFRTYNGPKIDRVQIEKSKRRMALLSGDKVVRKYEFELGFEPTGHKMIEGDGRTPEGAYTINRRNPNSRFHLSLGISYPNRADKARANAMGKSPGGDIFIHGTPDAYVGEPDWTWGCIAVTNAEMEEIYAMVDDGTVIYLYA